MQVTDETKIVKEAVKGDEDAFSSLVRMHYESVFRFAYSLCKHETDAQDITQETFIRLGRSIKNFKSNSKFTTWLFKITMSVRSDFYRKQSRQTKIKESLEPTEASYTFSVDNPLLDALHEIPEEQKNAVILTYFEGFSHKEAAEILKCSETTVSWRIFRAKGKIKDLLTQ